MSWGRGRGRLVSMEPGKLCEIEYQTLSLYSKFSQVTNSTSSGNNKLNLVGKKKFRLRENIEISDLHIRLLNNNQNVVTKF
jgi:hypothetical protein